MKKRFLIALLLGVCSFLPQSSVQAVTYSYPTVSPNVAFQWYKTTFPSGLIYSQGWYGTFAYAPPASQILLFDDSYNATNGLCLFSMPLGVVPSGAQGGTELTRLTYTQAYNIVHSYDVQAEVKPFSPDIQAVMPSQAYFNGVWAGDKLQQKWYLNQTDVPPPNLQTALQKQYIAATANVVWPTVNLTAYDPNRYWVGGTGNWSQNNTHWSASSNGTPGASLPTNADNTFFDANSSNGTVNWTVSTTVGSIANCMDWTGATNTPALALNEDLRLYGNILTLITAMSSPASAKSLVLATETSRNITIPIVFPHYFKNQCSGTVTLQSDLNITSSYYMTYENGDFNTNGKTVTCGVLALDYATTRNWSLGNSTLNCASYSYATGTGLTISPNTAIINISGTGALAAGNVNYNGATFNLNGTVHTLSGIPTGIAALNLKPAGVQTITATGSSISAGAYNRSGTGLITINGGNFTLTGNDPVALNNVRILNSIANGVNKFFGLNAYNGGNNIGWQFWVPRVMIW